MLAADGEVELGEKKQEAITKTDEFDEPEEKENDGGGLQVVQDDITDESKKFMHDAAMEKSKRTLILLFCLVVYIAIGVVWYTQVEDNTFEDALFLVIIIITTVGYGTETAKKETMWFMIFYAFLGVSLIGGALGMIVENLTTSVFMHEERFTFLKEGEEADEEEDDDEEEKAGFKIGDFWVNYYCDIWCWLAIFLAGAAVITEVEDWTYLQGVYFAMISSSTIGFGDFTPVTRAGKWITIFYLPFMIVYTGYIFSTLFDNVLQKVANQQGEELLKKQARQARMLTAKNFEKRFAQMDVDGDGHLELSEYIMQSIMNEYQVSNDYIQMLKANFKKLDADGSGKVDVEDLRKTLRKNKSPKADEAKV